MGNCTFSDSSMGGRCALYCSSASMRNAGRPASNAHTMASGCEMSMNFNSMAMKPNTALVGVPSGAFMVSGTAWNARCISELPSMTATFFSGMGQSFSSIRFAPECNAKSDPPANGRDAPR